VLKSFALRLVGPLLCAFLLSCLSACNSGTESDTFAVIIVGSDTPKAAIEGEKVLLQALYQSPENIDLPAQNFVWESNIDGWLGEGLALETHRLSVGDHQILLKASDVNGSVYFKTAKLSVLSASSVIESMLFGVGELAPTEESLPGFGNACSARNYWSGFPAGSDIAIIVSENLNAKQKVAIEQNVDSVGYLSQGHLHAHVVYTADSDPIPKRNEVTVTTGKPPAALGCLPQGCTVYKFQTTGIVESARVILPSTQNPQAFAHDVIGHAIFGLCHIDGNKIGDPINSLMALGDGIYSHQIPDYLTAIDRFVVSTVFSSGLSPGSSRRDFYDVGLVSALVLVSQ
jgi:hypothetical protein